MSQILSFCEENLSADSGFRKLVYKKLIHNEQLSGNLVCLALIDQGILDADNASYEELQNGDAQTAFTFIREKIGNTELTPAQIALDPCSGSAIVTDTTTGELLAMVSYPGYDLNMLNIGISLLMISQSRCMIRRRRYELRQVLFTSLLRQVQDSRRA